MSTGKLQDAALATALFSNNQAPIAYMDAEFNFLRVNNAFAELENKALEFFPERNFFDLYPDPEIGRLFQEVVRSGSACHGTAKPLEFACSPENGVTFWDWTLSPVLLETGAARGLLLVLTKVTEPVREVMQSGKEKEFCQEVIDSAGEVIMLLDAAGRIAMVNLKLGKLLGIEAEELKGRVFWQLASAPEDDQAFSEALSFVFKNDKERLLDTTITDGEGSQKRYLWNMSLLKNNVGPDQYVICIGTDFSYHQGNESKLLIDSKEFEELLEQSKREALAVNSEIEKSDELKSRLIINIGHELRTPLNAIIGFTQLLKMEDEGLNENQQSHLNEILHAAEGLNDLIRSLTNYSLILDNKLKMRIVDIPEREIHDMCADLRLKPKKLRNVEVINALGDGKDIYVRADKKYLKEILGSMISKATNLSREGGQLIIGMEKLSDQQVRLYIEGTTETDSGVTNVEFASLAELEAKDSKVDWYDLIYIVARRMIRALGGEEGFVKQGDKGFRFNLDLPSSVASNRQATHKLVATQAERRKSRVLYVEDNEANRRLVYAILLKEPHIELQMAKSGAEGIELAERDLFDLIILDINLPDMSGYEVLEVLKNSDSVNCGKYFALTANSMKEEIERGLEAGFDKYITKPFEIRKFIDALNTEL